MEARQENSTEERSLSVHEAGINCISDSLLQRLESDYVECIERKPLEEPEEPLHPEYELLHDASSDEEMPLPVIHSPSYNIVEETEEQIYIPMSLEKKLEIKEIMKTISLPHCVSPMLQRLTDEELFALLRLNITK
jgi:hypothetical protein